MHETKEGRKPMTGRQREVRRLRKMLGSMADLAQHASLTGSLDGGAPIAVRRYNGILQQLERRGILKDSFFGPLPDNTGFDELGVDCTLLSSYLSDVEHEEEEEEEEGRREQNGADEQDEEQTLRQPLALTRQSEAITRELDELRRLGQVIREHLPEWLTERAAAETAGGPQARLASSDERGQPSPAALPEPS